MVKRYSSSVNEVLMFEDGRGGWVKWEDHDELAGELGQALDHIKQLDEDIRWLEDRLRQEGIQ